MPSLEQLERLLAADPADAFVLYGIGQEYAKRGEPARAIEFYDRCLQADPAYCYAYYHKARVLDSMGQRDQAIIELRTGFKRAQELGDNHAASEISALLDELT